MNSGPTPISELQPGMFIAGRYKIAQRLGSGGMGIVFKAVDQELDDTVAIKLLHPHLAQDETVYRRFRNEVLVARALTHPNIVRTHDMGRADGGYSYISMEFVGGKSLRELLQKEEKDFDRGFQIDQALEILFHILSGVAYAHGKDIIHRDLKPANVLVNDDGEVKLADFGTARILGMETSITRMGQVVGTPDYMSPEQIRGEELTPHCDIYSLGIIAYELVTAQRPFVADTPVAVAFKHLNEAIPEIDASNISIPDWYSSLISIATAKKIEDRFNSVSEMAQFILEHCPGMNKKSGIFPSDVASFASSASRDSVASTSDRADKVDVGADTISSSVPKRFELGDVQPTSSGGWTLSAEASREVVDAVEQSEKAVAAANGVDGLDSTVVPPQAKASRGGLYFLLLVLLLCSSVASVRFIQPLNQLVRERIGPLDTDDSLYAIASVLLGESSSLVDNSEVEPGDTMVQEREELQDELLAFVGVDELPEELSKDSPQKASTKDGSKAKVTDSQDKGAAETSQPDGDAAKQVTVAKVDKTTTNTTASNQETKPAADKSVSEAVEDKKSEAASKTASEKVQSDQKEKDLVEPEPVVLKPSAGELALYQGSSEVKDASIRFSELSSMRWRAELQGMPKPKERSAQRKAVGDTRVNIFDPKTAQIVASQPASHIRSGQGFVIEGRLREVARKLKNIGQYRLDLVYGGEVLQSKEISLYKASVSLSMPNRSANSHGGRVAIVRGAKVVDPKTKANDQSTDQTKIAANALPQPVGETNRPSNSEAQNSAGEVDLLAGGNTQAANIPGGTNSASLEKPLPTLAPSTTAVARPTERRAASANRSSRVFLQTPSGSRVAEPYGSGATSAGNVGLPPARGSRPAAAATGPGVVDNTSSLAAAGVSPPPSAVERESWSGVFRIAVGAQPEQDRALILNLQTRGVTISGSANIAGFDQFRVSGEVTSRGIVLLMMNSKYKIRMSGSRRDSALRGSYNFPALKQRGSWRVTKAN